MTTIHVITKDNLSLYEHPLEEYFRLRHEVFVRERGWQGLHRPDGREIDAYDNSNAIYLLAIEQDRVVGGQRLYPTVLPHMLSDVFGHMAPRGILRADRVFEWTRYFVVKERRMGRTDCRLLAAVQEYCLEEGITELTAVVEMWWLPRWQQTGFKVKPLGLPTTIEGQPCIAASITVSPESLEQVRRIAGLRGSVLERNTPLSPAIRRVPHVAA
ncbi:acyl-homoserine-lactone synthase [Microvirga lotononidis]|uniref:Acyl-homoserine-lactone synthase n=1 Tax=Microvirga lotononidis TaxID=864069 RepID=I4YUR3_9HYPH|nr:acyl-homoserine-lactone synthase [Microvirga lotononidis]EIM27705.1 N-acyl-L-homoserine lactone synthetase [Microvirga lotononidis]WQO28157.1 acyl-homoserine-lactone synthase [Microvirga lotononidis]